MPRSNSENPAASAGHAAASQGRPDVIERFALGMAKVVDAEADRLWIPKLTFEVPG